MKEKLDYKDIVQIFNEIKKVVVRKKNLLFELDSAMQPLIYADEYKQY